MEYLESGARLSSDKKHRLFLWREWESSSKGDILFVMLNPSVADGTQDDPTIRRCVHFAKRLGGHRLSVVNLFSWRATDPKELPADRREAFGGAENLRTIMDASRRASVIVCAWGSHGTDEYDRSVVRLIAAETLAPLKCLGVGTSGAPLHPCRLPNDQPFADLPLRLTQKSSLRNMTFAFPRYDAEIVSTWSGDDFFFTAIKDAMYRCGRDSQECYQAYKVSVDGAPVAISQRLREFPNGARIEIR